MSTKQFYADTVNSQFHKSESHYVNIAQRFKESCRELWQTSTIDDAILSFSSRFKNTKWTDLKFCTAQTASLSSIEIDITLQRVLDIIHCGNIIDHFKALMVMPISVYQDPSRPGKYICWDGQHTAIVLYLIACKVFKLNIDDVRVPIVVYASSLKNEMRECFITLNGEGKKQLDSIDKVHQMIFGVRTDGSKNPVWELIEAKQTAFEQCKLFLTHEKFGDTTMPGAQARLDEFVDSKNYDYETTVNFAKYFFKLCQSNRPVEPKESWMIYTFFQLCKNQNIQVDDGYIKAVADSLNKATNNSFSASELYSKAVESWQQWFIINKPSPDGSMLGIYYPERRLGMTYLLAQVAKNFNTDDGARKLPKMANPLWPVATKDLM